MEYGGNKKPMWQWVVIYLIIGVIIYGIVYYFFFMNKSGTSYQPGTAGQPTSQVTTGTTSAAIADVTAQRSDPNKGVYLTDLSGMTLYTFDKDTMGVSNCTGTCLTLWPAYLSTLTSVSQPNLTIITRPDGSKQYAWMGKPLYYYSKDAKVGDLTGDGFNDIWHIVKP